MSDDLQDRYETCYQLRKQRASCQGCVRAYGMHVGVAAKGSMTPACVKSVRQGDDMKKRSCPRGHGIVAVVGLGGGLDEPFGA